MRVSASISKTVRSIELNIQSIICTDVFRGFQDSSFDLFAVSCETQKSVLHHQGSCIESKIPAEAEVRSMDSHFHGNDTGIFFVCSSPGAHIPHIGEKRCRTNVTRLEHHVFYGIFVTA
jgi:hypothetical protein